MKIYLKIIKWHFLLLLLILITNTVSADESTVQLKWQIPVDNLYYFTNFGQANGEENYFELNVDKILDEKKFNGEVEDRISKIQFPEEANMITVLEELSNGNIKSTSYLQNFTLPVSENELPDEKAREEAKKFEEMMNKVPQLQGVINSSGHCCPK